MTDSGFRGLGASELCWIAGAVLGIDHAVIERACRHDLVDSAAHAPSAGFGDIDVYETLADKTAVLGYRILRNHPFPDGNKRTAFIAMAELAERNGHIWEEPDGDPAGDDTVSMMIAAAASEISEQQFADWVRSRLSARASRLAEPANQRA